jgi:hypothetical protein
LLIGATGFEPATFRPPAGCATRLRHAPCVKPTNLKEGPPRPTSPRSPSESNHCCAVSVRNECEHVFGMGERNTLRRCGRCGELKPVSEYAWRRKKREQRDNMCRPCRSAYHREHYLANKQRYVDQARARKQVLRRERTSYLLDYFATHPCTDCGEGDPVVLEFDHLDADSKAFNISQGLSFRNWQSVLDEIEKCEVVCANCHRRRTARRCGALRTVLNASPK